MHGRNEDSNSSKEVTYSKELYRRLWYDQDLRETCDIEAEQKQYHPSQMTRFRNRIGTARLERIMGSLVDEHWQDCSDGCYFHQSAHSKRDPHENSRGCSDPQARVGRNGKTYELGYKLHIAVDAKSELPLAVIVASANVNEKKHAPALLGLLKVQTKT